jgi:hypothetical protein
VTATEYKCLFGLATQGLLVPAVREKLQQKTPEQIAHLRQRAATWTPEQRSAVSRGKSSALEVRRKLASGGRVEVPCAVCGTVVERWRCKLGPSKQPVCSSVCQRRLLSQITRRPRGGRVSFSCSICGAETDANRSRLARTNMPTCGAAACTSESLRRQAVEREKYTRRGRRRQPTARGEGE